MGRELIVVALLIAGCGAPRPIPTDDHEGPAEHVPRADRVRARAIRIATLERTPEQARERARTIARTARADDFSELAQRYGDDEEPRRSELGSGGIEITIDAPLYVPREVREAALALEPREISAPIDAEDGCWILQRLE